MVKSYDAIRRISTSADADESSPLPPSSLEHTLTMGFHDDDEAVNFEASDNGKFSDSSTLSQSLETIERTTFDKRVDETDKGESAKRRKANNPFAKKSIMDIISSSFRTNCDKPLDQITESISIALKDPFHESYGVPKQLEDGTIGGINVKEVKNLTYSCSNLSFNPKTCTWLGQSSYKCGLVTKTSSPKKSSSSAASTESSSKSKTTKSIINSYSGTFLFSVSCQRVHLASDLLHRSGHNVHSHHDHIQEEKEWLPSSPSMIGNSKSDDKLNKSHYCIDIEAILGGDDDDDVRDNFDRYVLKIISQALTHIGYDIARALYWLDLPDFPQGCKDVTFRSIYQLNAKIKSGAFATVCLGTNRASKQRIAVKCVQRKNLPPSDDVAIHSEVGILGALRHDYICPIIDFFMEEECYYIIMDLMEGGDVFDRVGQLEYYDESIARDLCAKMLKGIAYCHEQNIAHCDLKPKNLLLKTKNDDASVMLADFGFATSVFAPKTLTKQCGTPYFVAPEILLREKYDQKADMWSIGVIIYCILSGQLPFTGMRHLDLFKAIIAGEFTFDEGWENVSDDAKDLISKLLITDPDKRYTAMDALGSKWIRQNDLMLMRNSLTNASSRLRNFNARLKLKTTILVIQSLSRWKLITKKSTDSKKQEEEASKEE